MKRLPLFITLLFLSGCGSKTETGVNIPDESTIKKEIVNDVKNMNDRNAPNG